MSVANQVHTGQLAARAPSVATTNTSWWERPALFRYGFVLLILIVWQIVGPFINPIFFTYPTKIALAFYDTTMSGELQVGRRQPEFEETGRAIEECVP